ncbi:hypothetical protein FQN57_004391 [Myotisia sp. PD_48]|nr:hypothetical protein FQN57_004391 [Myotisia sp. PD_48]
MASQGKNDEGKGVSSTSIELSTFSSSVPEESNKDAQVEAPIQHEDPPQVQTSASFRKFMSFVSMGFLWTGSQIPVYMFGACPPYIYRDIGGADRWVWFVLGYLLSLAAICPFVGSISDLVGRRMVAIGGATLVCLGMVVCSTAETMNIFIAGMTITGAGAGINELTSLAATSEMAPTRKRGKYVTFLMLSLLPFVASVLWAQLIAFHSGWRYVGLFCGVWSGIGLLVTLAFYHPPPRDSSRDLSRADILRRIDYVGGVLSITGTVLFLAGFLWGGYQYPWRSSRVLAPLLIGFVLLIIFVLWETFVARYPMFPLRVQDRRTFILTILITFISGANFFSIIMFWPTQAFNVYGHDPVQVGLRGLPVGCSMLAGVCIVLWLLSAFEGRYVRELLIISSSLMTAGCGAMAYATVDNLHQVWGILVMAGLGIGGIVVPASIIAMIVCPVDLIGTVAALTLSIRVLGGSIGYAIYYNIFVNKFVHNAVHYIGGTMATQLGIRNQTVIKHVIELTGASLLDQIRHVPGIRGNEAAYQMVVKAGQTAFAESYKWVYYVSIGSGGLCVIAACFLGDIEGYMDDNVAVVMD